VFLSWITHIGIVMTTCPGAEMVCSVVAVLALEQLFNTIAMILCTDTVRYTANAFAMDNSHRYCNDYMPWSRDGVQCNCSVST